MRFNYTTALQQLKEYALSEGYLEVKFDHTAISQISWYPQSINRPLRILIEGKYSVEVKVYLLLHELGHHILRKDWDLVKETMPVIHEAESTYDLKFRRRQSYIVACMFEEFKAWDEGLKLAEEFGIQVDPIKWERHRSKCLMSYIRFYSTLRK